MGLTTVMRYFVIALLIHVGIVFLLASIKIATAIPPMIISAFNAVPPPPPIETEPDPLAALRNVEYNGPTTGAGGGTPGVGPGGIPTAAGNTPTEYHASIVDPQQNNSSYTEVIGVISDIGTAMRPSGATGGIAGPTTGMGTNIIVTTGVWGPGGGGFNQRLGPVRSQIMGKTRRGKEIELAVMAGLRWLQQHQQPNGSWNCVESKEAGTALAVLAFLGHGETTESPEFGETVNKGIQYLVSSIDEKGIVRGRNMYAQGAVTLALAEAYGMTGAPAVKEPLDRAIHAICASQSTPKANPAHVGGWRYAATSDDSDTSVSGWMIMALKSAKLAGATVPEEAFSKASTYLWAMYSQQGFGYKDPGVQLSTTAIGVLCQQFMGHNDDKRIAKALDHLKHQTPEWDKTSGGWVLYYWYYTTQAMFQAGGDYWTHWNIPICDAMLKNQSDDGHWNAPPNSTAETRYGENGHVYTTSLCCLILEVYYRYAPMYRELEKPGLGAAPARP